MMRRPLSVALVVVASLSVAAAPAQAAPVTSSPKAQFRSFACDNGATYDAAFIGVAPGNFLLINTSSVFVLKVFTLIWPSGKQKTYNYGLPGFTDKPLLTCSYVDPQGLLNVFSGFITPQA